MPTGDDATVPAPVQPSAIRARPAGFLHDVASIAGRALRAVPRDLEAVIPPIFIALFFFVVNIGTLSDLTESNIPGFDYKAFQMPTAILPYLKAQPTRRAAPGGPDQLTLGG